MNGEPNEQRLLGQYLLLLRTSALGGRRGHMEAFGWLAVDGAYMYPNTAPTPSQVSALSAYNSAMRFARGGLDHLHLPVELRW